MRQLLYLVIFSSTVVNTSSCLDKDRLAKSSFGRPHTQNSQASPASVISMGRDDDDGKAKKWHIGGGEN